MKTAILLAWRNLIGAGTRTWLNVIVLSFSFLVIIWLKGILLGWDYQAKNDMSHWEIGGGQYWHEQYDPYDPFTLADSHAPIPEQCAGEIAGGEMTPLLLVQGTLYPQGRMQSVTIRGVDPAQQIFLLPTHQLDSAATALPAIIGHSMAQDMQLQEGDHLTLRWRDAAGTFDATEILIAGIFASNVPAIENGQLYLALERLWEMTGLEGEATLLTYRDEEAVRTDLAGWVHKPKEELTASVDRLIRTKSAGQSVFYLILLLLAMLAIFDTQILSIFRRQKEIGTYIALGYTRREVVGLFTLEGAIHALLAVLLSAVYGVPFLAWQARVGWTIPMDAGEFGMAMAQTLYPMYSVGLVLSTMLIVLVTTTLVSYWPSRKIAKMNPTEALRGRIQ